MYLTSFCTFAHRQIILQFQEVLSKSIQNQSSEKGGGGVKPRKASFSKKGIVNKN